LFGGYTILKNVVGGGDQNTTAPVDGRAFATTSWNYFPQVKPFELTDQSGQKFSSTELAGKPYAISFFFSNCNTICEQLNRKIQSLADEFDDEEMMFVSITCDPKNDTPEVLARYAENFEADPKQWRFLTEQMYKIQAVGRDFDVTLDLNSHTDDIMLVDKWGRFRDRFTWDDPIELARFEKVAKELLKESEPPIGEEIRTRNVLAGVPHDKRKKKWLDEFFLVDHEGHDFYSRDLTGEVWIGSLFFSNCTVTCRQQNEYLSALWDRTSDRSIKFVSISTDPLVDTPAVLREYRRSLGIETESWKFLTGNGNYIRRVSEEYFTEALTNGRHHSNKLFVVDKWGGVRGSFDWQEQGAEARMLELVDRLLVEASPYDRYEINLED